MYYEVGGYTMLGFIIGVFIGAAIGFILCAILTANGKDNSE
jgi:hypothetical protein